MTDEDIDNEFEDCEVVGEGGVYWFQDEEAKEGRLQERGKTTTGADKQSVLRFGRPRLIHVVLLTSHCYADIDFDELAIEDDDAVRKSARSSTPCAVLCDVIWLGFACTHQLTASLH